MSEILKYTTVFAPVVFFVGGVVIVMLLNKFIGKHSSQKKSG